MSLDLAGVPMATDNRALGALPQPTSGEPVAANPNTQLARVPSVVQGRGQEVASVWSNLDRLAQTAPQAPFNSPAIGAHAAKIRDSIELLSEKLAHKQNTLQYYQNELNNFSRDLDPDARRTLLSEMHGLQKAMAQDLAQMDKLLEQGTALVNNNRRLLN